MKRSGLVVWLDAPAEVLAARVGGTGGRPLLEGDTSPDRFDEILAQREQVYRSAADVRIDTTTGGVEDVVSAVVAAWNRS
jgi:shikimate dehydrogenase